MRELPRQTVTMPRPSGRLKCEQEEGRRNRACIICNNVGAQKCPRRHRRI